jgi:hypothetical protein
MGVVLQQVLQRIRPAPGAGVHDTGSAAPGADDPLRPATPIPTALCFDACDPIEIGQ